MVGQTKWEGIQERNVDVIMGTKKREGIILIVVRAILKNEKKMERKKNANE